MSQKSELAMANIFLSKGIQGIKLFLDVLFIPKIDQNLLSVGHLLEKGYSIVLKKTLLNFLSYWIRNIHYKNERKKIFTRLDGRGVNCPFKHNK